MSIFKETEKKAKPILVADGTFTDHAFSLVDSLKRSGYSVIEALSVYDVLRFYEDETHKETPLIMCRGWYNPNIVSEDRQSWDPLTEEFKTLSTDVPNDIITIRHLRDKNLIDSKTPIYLFSETAAESRMRAQKDGKDAVTRVLDAQGFAQAENKADWLETNLKQPEPQLYPPMKSGSAKSMRNMK